MMQMRTLGTDLNVSAVGLGCMGFSHAYGAPTEEAEAVRLIRRAFDLGYTFFDTAEVYGTADAPHVNETLVGKALADVKNHTVIATKFGLRFDQESGKVPLPLVADSRPETIRKSVEGSLKRLGTDHIDLYFQHRIDPNVEPVPDWRRWTMCRLLHRMQGERKIPAYWIHLWKMWCFHKQRDSTPLQSTRKLQSVFS